MGHELDDLDSLLEEALGVADESLARELAPPNSLFAEASPSVAPPPLDAQKVAVAEPKAPKNWLDRHAAALEDGEATAQTAALDDRWEDDPL